MGTIDCYIMDSLELYSLQFNRRPYPPPNPQRDADTPVDRQRYEKRSSNGKVDS